MARTPDSNSSTYLSSEEFLKRVDRRTVGDLVSDDGTRVPSASLISDTNLAACLLDASGAVEAACLVGKRYTPEDLATLTGASLGHLYRLITRLTMLNLYERRPDENRRIPETYTAALDELERLQKGERIFGFIEHEEAGYLDHEKETAQDVVDRNGTVVIAERFFGTRTNRLQS